MPEVAMRAHMRSLSILRSVALGLLLGSQCTQAAKARTTAHTSARARKNGVEALELLPIALSQADTSASDTVAANAAVNALTLKESSNSQVDLANLTDSIQTLFGLSGQVVPVPALTVTAGQPTSQPSLAAKTVPSASPTKQAAAAVTSAATAGSKLKTSVSKVAPSKSSSLRLSVTTSAAPAVRVREKAPAPASVSQVHGKVRQEKPHAKAPGTHDAARALPSSASTVAQLPSSHVHQTLPVAVPSTATPAGLASLNAKLVKTKPLPAKSSARPSSLAVAPSSTPMRAPVKVTSRAAVHTVSVPRAHPTASATLAGTGPATTTAPLRAVAKVATSLAPEVSALTSQVPSALAEHSTTAAAPVAMWRAPAAAPSAASRRTMSTSPLPAVSAVPDQVSTDAEQMVQTALPVKPAAATTTVLHSPAITADNSVSSGTSTEKSPKSPTFGSWLFATFFGSNSADASPAAAAVSKPAPQRPKFTKQDIEGTASKARREFLMDVAISDGFSRLEHEDEGHVQHVRHEDEALRVAAETPQLGAIAPPLAEDADGTPPSSAASGFWGSLASEDGQIEHAVEENNGDNLREYARLTEMQDNRVASMMSELEDPEPAMPASRLRASAERSSAR